MKALHFAHFGLVLLSRERTDRTYPGYPGSPAR